MSIEESKAGVCPCCPKGCSLDAPGCIRGEAYAHSLSCGPEGSRESIEFESVPHSHGPHGHGPGHGPHDHGPRGHGPGCGPHHHGPHGPGHGPRDHGPGWDEGAPPPPPHECGPHGRGMGPGRGARPFPPEPEPDRDSLTGLMRRCGHYLFHRVGTPGTRERMLRLLAERGDMNQSDFVYLLDLRSASVSELLGKLEAQGLITRRRSEADRRGVTISLTEAGRAQAPSSFGEDTAFSALTDEERAQLQTLLQKLLASWEETRE